MMIRPRFHVCTSIVTVFLIAIHFSGISLVYGEEKNKVTTRSIRLDDGRNITLRGRLVRNDLIEEYRSVPFAQPPVRELRFQPPRVYRPAENVKTIDTRRAPKPCWQYYDLPWDRANPSANLWLNNTAMSEDCLQLSVWTPKPKSGASSSATLLPVMLWIYGGSFYSGNIGLEVYDGSVLAEQQQVVVVTVNYRVGAFGFLYLPGVIPANVGLMDQRMAMQWVSKHIHAFNGNPQEITLFGESAGSVSASIHMMLPDSYPLFKRAILQSGSMAAKWATLSKAEAAIRATKFVESFNCNKTDDKDTLKCLQTEAPEKLATNLFSITQFITRRRLACFQEKHLLSQSNVKTNELLDIPAAPVVDGEFIPKPFDELVNDVIAAKKSKPVIFTMNNNEGMYFLFYGMAELNFGMSVPGKGPIIPPELAYPNTGKYVDSSQLVLRHVLPMHLTNERNVQLVMNAFRIPSSELTALSDTKWTSDQVLDKLSRLAGETHFKCAPLEYLEKYLQGFEGGANTQSSAYLALFNHHTKESAFPSWTGMMHGYEIEYVFGMPFQQKFQAKYYRFSDAERKMSKRVMQYYGRFAKLSKPAHDWPAYSRANRKLREIKLRRDSDNSRMTGMARRCTFWRILTEETTNNSDLYRCMERNASNLEE